MGSGGMSVRQHVLSALASDSKETFLLALGHRLAISARECFTLEAREGMRQAEACNEMMIVIWVQVLAMKDEGTSGYPDPELLSILVGKADAGEARRHLRNAIEGALRSIAGDGASS